MATEKLGLSEIVLSQAAKEITHNEALRQIEGRTVGASSRTTTAPPGSPTNGDVYIIPTGATGEWSGKTNQLAHRYGGVWNYWTPVAPVRLWVADEQLVVVWNGTDWVTLVGPSLIPPFVDTTTIVKGSADATKLARLEVDGFTTGTTRVLTPLNKDYTLEETGHASKHVSGGSDAIKLDDLAAPDDNTDLNASASVHGLLRKLSGSASQYMDGSGAWTTPAGTGVTSVAFSAPAEFSVSGSPITSTGTITLSKANQSANQVYAGPTSGGAAAPAFRALVAADMVYRNLVLEQIVFGFTTDVTTGDGAGYMVVPSPMNGLNLVRVHARVITAGTTGTTDIQINNVTQAADMLSTKITIDSTETGSDTAATPAVIDTGNDDVATNDLLRIDIDAVSTTKPKGLLVTLEFAL
jgi:hypothetical protein